MKHNFKRYLPFLTKNRKFLVYSNRDFSEYEHIFNDFDQVFYEKIDELTIKNASFHFVKDGVDTVLLYPDNDFNHTLELYEKIHALDENVDMLLVIPDGKVFDDSKEIMNRFDALLGAPFSEDELAKKMFTMLSDMYALRSIANHDVSLKKEKNTDEESRENFLDTYEGSALFLSEALQEFSQQIDDGYLSEAFLENVALKIDEVQQTFKSSHYTQNVAPIFEELSAFLRAYDLGTVDVDVLEGFDYLGRIIEDISFYINEYFVDRVFSDVYVFEHSLENSIVFMENKLLKQDDNDSEIEFF